MEEWHTQSYCMQHCEKLGGRSPPVKTIEHWETLSEEEQNIKGADTFHSAGQSKEGYVGFGTSEHPVFMKLLPDHLWH